MILKNFFSIKRKSLNFFFKNVSSSKFNELKVFNSLSKQKETISLKNDNVLYWYSCGPTVYDSAHIGHASSYVNFDIIKRILTKYFQINVVNLMNITDIDDKIIKKANQENKTFNQIATYYENEFFQDLQALNCIKPSIVLRVTQHIPEIIQFINKLIEKNVAYATKSGNVYFNTKKFEIKSFFTPSEIVFESEKNDSSEKLHPFDFALWKSRKQENEPSWMSPWGMGRPGWHIECSTLASIGFGVNLDFHSGGKDLIFPHHHNELTQCCAYFEKNTWSSIWLHTGHLHLKNDVKMSKSLSNTISIREMLKNYTSNEFRFFCLLSPYRNDKEFSEEKMTKAVNLSKSFQSFINFCHSYSNQELKLAKFDLDEKLIFEKLKKTEQFIQAALCDDFNTSLCIVELFELVSHMNKLFQSNLDLNLNQSKNELTTDSDLNLHLGCIMSVCNYIESVLDLFGLDYKQNKGLSSNENSMQINQIIESSLKFRKSIRNLAMNKNIKIPKEAKIEMLKYCDELRDEFSNQNIELKDLKSETIWQFKK